MNTEEAKLVLQSYRPNGADAGDPAFAAALSLVQNDPTLREWFERRQKFDRAVSAEYDEIQAPPGVRDAILAAAADVTPSPATRRKTWHRVPIWAGIAASVAVLIAASAAFWLPRPQAAATSRLADFAVEDAQHPKTHGGHGDEAAALNHLLNLPTTHLTDPLAVNFDALRNTGARTLNVEGRDVLEVCFKRGGVGLHCYVARRQDFPELRAPPHPAVFEKPNAAVATWQDQSNLYIVVTKPGREALEKLL